MFVWHNSSSLRGLLGLMAVTLLLGTGCSQSSNPVGHEGASDGIENESEQLALEIPADILQAVKNTAQPDVALSSAAESGEEIVAYTFDDLGLDCRFNTEFPSVYQGLELSDSRMLARCPFDGGAALVPTDLVRFNSSSVARNLITLPTPATAVSIEAFGIRDSGPRNFVAYGAAGNEVDRASFGNSGERIQLTVTGDIHRVAIIDYQSQTYWDNLTVTYGAPAEPLVADAGPDQQILETEPATLTGSVSGHSESDALTYLWTWTSVPHGSRASFSSASSAVTSFTADLPGSYTARLVVGDGSSHSAPDEVTIVALPVSGALASLKEDVLMLGEGGELNKGQVRSLLRMLDIVQKDLEKQPHVAARNLKAFTGHVSGLVGDGVLTQEQGDTLINSANRIGAVLQVGMQRRHRGV